MMSSKTLWYLRILGTFFRKSVDIAPFLSQNDGESAIFSDSIRSFAFFCKMIDRYLMQWRCRCRTDYGLWIFSGVHFLFSISFWKSHSYLRMALFLFCAISTILKNSFCVFLQFSRFSEKVPITCLLDSVYIVRVHFWQTPFYQEIFFSLKQLILLCALSAFLLLRNNLLAGQRVSFLADWFPNLNGQSPWVAGTPVGRSPE